MDYIKNNKEAWEEAFNNRAQGWGDNLAERLEKEVYPFIEKVLVDELLKYDFNNKSVAQFCCNNGRELLTIMKLGAANGVGFDIAENMVAFANETAKQIGANCEFVATDILEIGEQYYNSFDYIFITVGALAWFEDLSLFFNKVSQCLKKGGRLIINEMHPIIDMLAAVGEENYDENNPNKLVNSYFAKEPWIENDGMGYMNEKPYKSKTFYSYSHNFSDIVTAICQSGIIINQLMEFDYDISGMFAKLNRSGIPLSYIIISQK